MPDRLQDDELVMALVETALGRPAQEREAYVREACGNDSRLFQEVWKYVQWNERISSFLTDPLCPARDESPFHPGQLVDNRFRIVREVAEGGMGVVYEAFDEKLDRRVAIKCAKAGFRQRLPPEVRNAREITHPNVCRIFEIHTTALPSGEFDFVTMEYLEGETLAERLAHGPLPLSDALSIAREVAAGVAEAHRKGVVHGDLKSSNVILTDDGARAVVTDFGLARAAGSAMTTAQSGERGGTPDYMAPELWRGEKASAASDVYALGVLLGEIASGRRPKGGSPEPMGSPWDAIVSRCLAAEPADRYPDASAVAEALEPKSRRWVLSAAAAAIFGLVSAAVAYRRGMPVENVRLAVLPVEHRAGAENALPSLVRDLQAELSRVGSSRSVRFALLPPSGSAAGATHTLKVTLAHDAAGVAVHADLSDARAQVKLREWEAVYRGDEIRFLAGALAGLATAGFRLPSLGSRAAVNSAAAPDYQSGLQYLRKENTVDEAVKAFERACAADPDSALTFAGLAEAYWFQFIRSRDPAWRTRAADAVSAAERRNPDIAQVHRIAGLLKASFGRPAQAEAEYRRAIELDPRNADGFRRLAILHQNARQLDAAISECRKAAELDPSDYRNLSQLGTLYQAAGDYNEAARHFERALALVPDEPLMYYRVAEAYIPQGRFTEAEALLRQGLRIREMPVLVVVLGQVLMYERKEADAVPLLRRVAELDARDYIPWAYLGICYRRLEQANQAAEADRKAMALAERRLAEDTDDGKARSFLAYICAHSGNRSRAQSEIAQALRSAPEDSDTREMAALTYEALGDREETLGVLKKASRQLLASIGRWPDVEDLQRDARFQQLVASQPVR